MRLFVDLDGVLADFEGGCRIRTGCSPDDFRDLSSMWEALKPPKCRDFYATLPLMPGAMELWRSLEHLRPTILTGLPRGNWAEPQKRAWVRRHFGRQVAVICCLAHEKPQFARRGDVLLDDTLKAQEGWEAVGGVFVHFTSATAAMQTLASMFQPREKHPWPVSKKTPSTVCTHFSGTGSCRFGSRCRFVHRGPSEQKEHSAGSAQEIAQTNAQEGAQTDAQEGAQTQQGEQTQQESAQTQEGAQTQQEEGTQERVRIVCTS